VKTSSVKAKGRRCCQELTHQLLKYFANAHGITEFKDVDRWISPSGVKGADVIMPEALEALLPLRFECKNHESISIWACLEQAEKYRTETELPALAFMRNRTEVYITMKAGDFFDLLRRCATTKT